MRSASGRRQAPQPSGRGSWAASRTRAWYNLVLAGFAAVAGLLLLAVPTAVGARPESRYWGAVLTGYGLVRGYAFYRRLRSLPRQQ